MWPRPSRSASRTSTSSSRSDPAATAPSGGPRSPGLDLLRAIAILLVLLSHCTDMLFAWLGRPSPALLSQAGFFGVELFFVLSGFLIGGLLLRIVDEGPTLRAWRVFMLRRWMRTLPVYMLWLAFLTAFWPPRFWEPDHWALAWRWVPLYATLTQNLAWPMPPWFGVSWSLTVEEWFYLGFSAVLFGAVLRFGRRAGFWTACALFLAVPTLLRLFVPEGANFAEVPTKVAVLRLDAIAYGVAMAWLFARGNVLFRRPLLPLTMGLLLILGLWDGWSDWMLAPLAPHLYRAALFSLGSAGFALCVPAALRLRRLPGIAGAAVLAISTQSYAMYVVHLSILEIVGYYRDLSGASPWLALAGSLALIWGLSWASWRWMEAPILARRPRQHDSQPVEALGGEARLTT